MDRTYTQSELRSIAEAIIMDAPRMSGGASVVVLTGDLGAGKTTLVQEIARVLGVEGTVQSPTFVVLKSYQTKSAEFPALYHMDAYRIEDVAELAPLRFESVVGTPGALVLIEWGERIKAALPQGALHVTLTTPDSYNDDRRSITYTKI